MDFLANLSNSSSWHLYRFIKADIWTWFCSKLRYMLAYWKMRIHFRDDNDCIFLLKSIMKVNNSLMVQSREQVHLPQSRCLPLGSTGHKFGSILHFPQLLRHTFHIGKCTSAAKTKRETFIDQWGSIKLKMVSFKNGAWQWLAFQFLCEYRSGQSACAFSLELFLHHRWYILCLQLKQMVMLTIEKCK